MKVVVDIPKITYEHWAKIANVGHEPLSYAERTILRGIPLPKGHGRLIDADNLMELAYNCVTKTVDCNDIARFPTIIEADKAESEDKE